MAKQEPKGTKGAVLSANRLAAIKEQDLHWRVLKQQGNLGHFIGDALKFLELPEHMIEALRSCAYTLDVPDHRQTLDIVTYPNIFDAMRGLVTMDNHCGPSATVTLEEARKVGIDQASPGVAPIEIKDPMLREEGLYNFEVACRLGFAVPELVVSLCPGSQMVQLCIPILVDAGVEMFGIRDDAVEVVFRSFIQVVNLVHKMVWRGDMSDGENLLPCVRMHKAEVRNVMGFDWWSKACSSDRQAVVLVDEARKRQKQQRIYMYLGGGSLSAESSQDMQGSVVRCKTWNLAISVALAVLVVTACSPGWHAVRLTKAAIVSGEEPTDDFLHSDSEPEENAADASGEFVERYDAAVERLLALTGPITHLVGPEAAYEDPIQTQDDVWANYQQLRWFFSRRGFRKCD